VSLHTPTSRSNRPLSTRATAASWVTRSAAGADERGRPDSGKLSPTQREIVSVCAEAVQQLGLSNSVGQIFGVIYGSPRPLSFTDVVTSLKLSKGSVSVGLRFLRELGAIKVVAVPGDRRELFVAETELRRLMAGVVQTRLRAPLESGKQRLKAIQQRFANSDEPDREFIRQRLASLQAWHGKALFFLPLVQKFIGSKD